MPRTPSPSIGSKLQDRLKTVKPETVRTGPLWKGPCAEGPLGGVTFSMLTRWLSCRERARVQYIEGIKPVERFNHRTDYGTMWHLCEEKHAANEDWLSPLITHVEGLAKKFPMDRDPIFHWFNVCNTQFPVYAEHWSKHDDVKKRMPLMQEQVFDVPYKLPSGRVVRLRGKFDSVDLIGVIPCKCKGANKRCTICKGSGNDPRNGKIYLQENKTKGDVDIQAIQRQLTWDLQTNLYLTALHYHMGFIGEDSMIAGVRYNVVRRPLSGGKGTITRSEGTKGAKCSKCKGEGTHPVSKGVFAPVTPCVKCRGQGRINAKPAESWEAFYGRLEQVIRDDPGHFFSRWKTEVTPHDIQRFRRECLDPILENIIDWYAQVTKTNHGGPVAGNYRTPLNWRHPFGSINTIDEYGAGDVDEYINNRSMTGLRRVNTLFEELT